MATITAFEAKTRFGELLERVGNGEEIIITRHEKPVARIVPEGRRSLTQVRQAVQSLDELRLRIGGGTTRCPRLRSRDCPSSLQN